MKRVSEEQVFVYKQHINYLGEAWGKCLIAVFRNKSWAECFVNSIPAEDSVQYVIQDTQD